MNGGEALVATLLAHGVDTAFCVPGESYLAVLEALRVNANRIRLITNRHESGASYGAAVYARIARRPGIAMVTRGPGATNASIGVHCAKQDSLPLVLFVGHVPSHEKGRESFQEIDYRLMFGAMAKAVLEPSTPADVARDTARALALATAGRPGPVVVVLPEDVTEGEAGEAHIPPARPRPSAAPTPAALAEAARLIARARAPIAIAGELVNFEAAHGALAAFVDRAGVGVVAAFRCQDAFDNDHPAYLGHFGVGRAPYQRKLWESCDLVIAVGNRLDAITTDDYRVPRDDQVLIHIHPEPTVLADGRTADLAIAADVGPSLAAITAALPAGTRGGWRVAYRQGFEASRAEGAKVMGRIDMAAVVAEIAARIAPDHVMVSEAGNFSGWVHRYFPFRRPSSQAAPMAGAMGWAVPGAIGAKLARPGAEVIALVGDGGFGMTGQEIATAVQEGVNVTVIVCDNGAYGTILAHQHRFAGQGAYHGVKLRSPDFAALGRAYGAAAWRVETTAEFAPAFAAARAHDGPALIHLVIDVRDISAYGPLAV
ncbi:MAG: thiamine pyrophosphate-binding protein [Alphaproteobacteria bacterium]|nr:thiamine pyrophosphate-binding protein [Alphaproteobacteria bacterium]